LFTPWQKDETYEKQALPRRGLHAGGNHDCSGIIGLLATIAIPNFVRARLKAQQNACINNLRQIDGAKQTWALETRPARTPPSRFSTSSPIWARRAGHAPTCPADSANSFPTSYSINDLQTAPTCLILPGVAGDTTGHHLD